MEKAVEFILMLFSGYLLCGLLFAFPFIAKGVTVVDRDGAKGTGWGFRLIIIPGTMVFWPLLLKKWIKVSGKKND